MNKKNIKRKEKKIIFVYQGVLASFRPLDLLKGEIPGRAINTRAWGWGGWTADEAKHFPQKRFVSDQKSLTQQLAIAISFTKS
ncbi:hypothetical protein Avbf_09550 [Armadillidium vulgare]|nr:hypothetical protein Avbf_09550 [Armadillidium vulgare]